MTKDWKRWQRNQMHLPLWVILTLLKTLVFTLSETQVWSRDNDRLPVELIGTIIFSDRTKSLIGSYHWDFFCIGQWRNEVRSRKGEEYRKIMKMGKIRGGIMPRCVCRLFIIVYRWAWAYRLFIRRRIWESSWAFSLCFSFRKEIGSEVIGCDIKSCIEESEE